MSSKEETARRMKRIEDILDENEVFREDLIARAALVNQLLWLVEDEVSSAQK